MCCWQGKYLVVIRSNFNAPFQLYIESGLVIGHVGRRGDLSSLIIGFFLVPCVHRASNRQGKISNNPASLKEPQSMSLGLVTGAG